jgi:hypothetical protein
MPLKSMSRSPDPGHLIQVCAGCGAEHRISLDRGAQKARTGPVTLQVGDTLEVRIDARPAATVTFAAGDFSDFGRVSAAELATKLQRALPGVIASDDAGGLLLESATAGPDSRIEITGGSARAALGFPTDGAVDPCPGRLALGASFGPGSMQDPNVLALRRCNDCGANECLVRTIDASATELDGTHFKEHRKAVNTLAEHCRARGWSHPDLAAHHAAELRRPIDVHPEFPERWELAKVVQQPPGSLAGQPTQVVP